MKPELPAKLAMLAAVCALGALCDRAAALTGAEAMPPEAFRFVAYVGDDYGYCTGAIIAPTWVLTAAHCVVHGDGSTIRPDEIGDLSRGWPDDDHERVPVKRVIAHPHYYWQGHGFRNDVALIETTRPFASSHLVPVAVLGTEDEALHAANGTTAVMIGYGEDENGQRERQGLFRVVRAPLYHTDACRAKHSFVDPRAEIVHDLTICAGDRDRGIRGGDSGGPLLVRTEDGYGLVGVASISGHASSGYPVVAVYTRLATAKDWIDGCVLGTGECFEGGVKLPELKAHGPDALDELTSQPATNETRSTGIIFVNQTAEVISYHWRDYDGREMYYGSVEPGETKDQHTYPGHVWAIKDAEERTFAVFVGEPEMGRATVTADMLTAAVDDIDFAQVNAVADDVDYDAASDWTRLPDADFPFEIHFDPSNDLDREITPWTWGGYPQGTQNRASPWDGVWAVYEESDGTVVQVSVWGSASDPSESGAAWRLRTASGWGDWNVGTGRYRIKTDSRLPRFTGPLDTEPSSAAMIIQAAQIEVPFLNREEPYISENEWRLSWLLMLHDETAETQTVLQCWYGCRAWQRGSDLAVVAAADPELPALHDGGAAVPTQPVALLPGLSREKIAQVLDEALSATTWNMHGEEVPDWGTRLRAVELAGLALSPDGGAVTVDVAATDNLRWVSAAAGDIPPSAIPGGTEAHGEVLYICRANFEGGIHPGKISHELGACIVPWGTREHYVDQYEVLTGGSRGEDVR